MTDPLAQHYREVALRRQKKLMIQELIELGIEDQRVLNAMSTIDRHRFLESFLSHSAYANQALPIAGRQFISQPFMVARMAEIVLRYCPQTSTVLELGTGSGYNAAILSQLFTQVYSMERILELHHWAQKKLAHFDNIHLFYQDGCNGLEQRQPYDAIIVTASLNQVPKELVNQLKIGGGMLFPFNKEKSDKLYLIRRDDSNRFSYKEFQDCHFVKSFTGVA